MCLGIFLSLLNATFHHENIDIIGEFIPQIIFMLSIFGYMVFLIFYKWFISSYPSGKEPPLILNIMISMFLSMFSLNEKNKLFNGQVTIFFKYIDYFSCIFNGFAFFAQLYQFLLCYLLNLFI